MILSPPSCKPHGSLLYTNLLSLSSSLCLQLHWYHPRTLEAIQWLVAIELRFYGAVDRCERARALMKEASPVGSQYFFITAAPFFANHFVEAESDRFSSTPASTRILQSWLWSTLMPCSLNGGFERRDDVLVLCRMSTLAFLHSVGMCPVEKHRLNRRIIISWNGLLTVQHFRISPGASEYQIS